MKSSESIPMSLSEFGQLESTPKNEGEYITSIIEYYNQLKSPYISAQQSIRQRLQAESELLRNCQSGIVLSGRQKNKVSQLKQNAETFKFEVHEMESGLNWATAKIRELDQEMESKIRLVGGRYDSAFQFQNNPTDGIQYHKGQTEKTAMLNF